MATVLAKPGPWASARKKMTGPEVKGKATSQPLTVGPHRRPARLAVPMSKGVRISLSSRLLMPMLLVGQNIHLLPYLSKVRVADLSLATLLSASRR
jgi:hypothetical protein